jgi:hypothetical protein
MRRPTRPHTTENFAASIPADPPNAPKEKQPNGQAKEEKKKESPPTTTFWELLLTLGERWQTEGLNLYVYRLWPITDTRNPERFLCKLQEPIDEDWLLKNFGSGKYWLALNNAEGKHLRTHVSNPHNVAFAPRVAPQEVIESNPQNKLFFEIWAKREGHPAATQRAEQNGAEVGNGSDAAVKELASLVKLAFTGRPKEEVDGVTRSLIDWALRQKDAERAENSPSAVANLIKEVKAILPTQSAASDPLAIIDRVLAIQNRSATDVDKIWRLAEKVHVRPEPNSSPDPLAGVEHVMDLFAKVRDLLKPDAATAPAVTPDLNGWQALGNTLIQSLPQAMHGLAAVIAAGKSGAAASAPATVPFTAAHPMTGFDPYRDVAAAREFARQQNAAAAPAFAAAPSPGFAPPQPEAATGQPANDGMAQIPFLIQTALSCMNRGIDGHACSESIITLNGELMYESLAEQIKAVGVPTVVQLAKGIPEIGSQVATFEGPLMKFITEFIEGPGWDDEDQEAAEKATA